MNTTENNKLLADFLVENEGGLIKLRENVYSTLDDFGMPDDDLILSDLKFHSDWNWLIQVVEKIESLDIYYNKYIDYNSSMFTNGKIELSTNIDHVYNACVSFIKWYNSQK